MQAVIIFDGTCNLCNATVQFILARDVKNYFKFAALHSNYATTLLSKSLQPNFGNSVLLVENGKIYSQSTAVLKIFKKLSGAWPLLYAFVIVPPFLRNGVYRFIANNRYKWFGKQENCWVPTASLTEKFLS